MPGLLVAALALPLLPRRRRVVNELLLIQAAWAAAAVGLVWQPLLDSSDGHLLRWLEFRDLDPTMVWLAPLTGLGLGAAIALRKATWDALGGFDDRYAPAYYEDTDLAFRVREAGLRTVASWPTRTNRISLS